MRTKPCLTLILNVLLWHVKNPTSLRINAGKYSINIQNTEIIHRMSVGALRVSPSELKRKAISVSKRQHSHNENNAELNVLMSMKSAPTDMQ